MARTYKDMFWRRRRVACFVAIAFVTAAGTTTASTVSADQRVHDAASSRESGEPIADRTLVPRRIRLIIGYKRPRLA